MEPLPLLKYIMIYMWEHTPRMESLPFLPFISSAILPQPYSYNIRKQNILFYFTNHCFFYHFFLLLYYQLLSVSLTCQAVYLPSQPSYGRDNVGQLLWIERRVGDTVIIGLMGRQPSPNYPYMFVCCVITGTNFFFLALTIFLPKVWHNTHYQW